MDMEVSIYNEDFRHDWEDFVFNKAINSTFLHSRAFFDHNPKNAGDDMSLVFFKGKKIAALLPANLYEQNGRRFLHSYLRSTYGGLLIDKEISIAEVDQIVLLLLSFAREKKINEIVIRQSFGIYHKTLCEHISYILWKNSFSIKAREFELAIEIDGDFRANYSDSTLRSIKKSQKQGVVVNESTDLNSYWEILEVNLKERFNTKPVHDIHEIGHLISLVGKDKVKLFAAFSDNKMIGGILVFIANSQVAHAQYIASDYAYQELRPLNAIIDHIASWSKNQGFKYFNLGMASEPGGEEINQGLCRFKEGFGARGVLRETMHLNL